ncbi:MAG: hypothetical protein MK135_07910, partial [Polyangiaceae bacterium]|nr:hypothetical protein [Polyangiaceae bacterium]
EGHVVDAIGRSFDGGNLGFNRLNHRIHLEFLSCQLLKVAQGNASMVQAPGSEWGSAGWNYFACPGNPESRS